MDAMCILQGYIIGVCLYWVISSVLVARVYAKTRKETSDRARLIAAAPQLRDALQAVMTEWPHDQYDWCCKAVNQLREPCGKCVGCLAYNAAKAALALCEEVGDAG